MASGDIWIFYPPLKRPTGGSAVLLQIARQLQDMGCLAGLLLWERSTPVPPDIPSADLRDTHLEPKDVLIVPEGWPNALNPGLKAGCECFVYCQNWAYLFQGLPADVRWGDLPVSFLAVSDPVAWYLRTVLGKRPQVLRPAIDRSIFYPPPQKPEGEVRVAYMPRKNSAVAEQIRRIFAERNPGKGVQWVQVQGEDAAGVSDILRSCHIFLSTGFPEGFSLPPLEAMACGCLCLGFTGFGGWDYMRQLESDSYTPHEYPLRPVSWGGNGMWFPDGDVLGAARGLERALDWLEEGGSVPGARAAVESYTQKSRQEALKQILPGQRGVLDQDSTIRGSD